LLISDSDRDQISAVLSEHMAEGRLTADELEQRIGALYESRTRAEAAALLAGLPALDAPGRTHHIRIGHEHDRSSPALPGWMTADGLVDTRVQAPGPATPAAPPTAADQPHRAEDRAAARRRTKQRADENAIGHTFQAKRRAIGADIESAIASGDRDEVERLNERLREARETADSARSAVAAGDRAELQRQLQRLRNIS
jgi:hypothetical protein